jgi:hypothetical protein
MTRIVRIIGVAACVMVPTLAVSGTPSLHHQSGPAKVTRAPRQLAADKATNQAARAQVHASRAGFVSAANAAADQAQVRISITGTGARVTLHASGSITAVTGLLNTLSNGVGRDHGQLRGSAPLYPVVSSTLTATTTGVSAVAVFDTSPAD